MKRWTIFRFCDCISDGWGCCCARPERAKPDPDGEYVLIEYEVAKEKGLIDD